MIVDVHTHVPTHRESVPAGDRLTDETIGSGVAINVTGSVADYLKAMAPVDRVIVFGVARQPGREEPPLLDWRQGWPEDFNQNDIAYEVSRAAPEKLIPYMSLHPGQADVDSEYDRAVGDLGCRGIKMSATYQVFDPIGEEAFRLYARLESDGLPVMFHSPPPRIKFRSPASGPSAFPAVIVNPSRTAEGAVPLPVTTL